MTDVEGKEPSIDEKFLRLSEAIKNPSPDMQMVIAMINEAIRNLEDNKLYQMMVEAGIDDPQMRDEATNLLIYFVALGKIIESVRSFLAGTAGAPTSALEQEELRSKVNEQRAELLREIDTFVNSNGTNSETTIIRFTGLLDKAISSKIEEDAPTSYYELEQIKDLAGSPPSPKKIKNLVEQNLKTPEAGITAILAQIYNAHSSSMEFLFDNLQSQIEAIRGGGRA